MTTKSTTPMLSSQVNCEALRDKWNADSFYAPDSVVLGLDIGIEGIGIAVRRGTEWLYAKTLLVDLPEAQALAERRAFRASRHARKNRRTRMRRLKELFVAHGLPWVSDDVMSRSDPFKLRYRAITGTLASAEALSICIRSCVLRRGYDYFAMNDDDGASGEMPWGESSAFVDAKQWLSSAYVDETMKQELLKLAPLLTFKNKELDDKKIEEWAQLIEERCKMAAEIGIDATLRDYAKNKLNERKARGRNYPRAHVEAHLRNVIQRHMHLIERPEEFVAALFRECVRKEDKAHAIFHFNRKTPREAALHFARKVKQCPYCSWLGLSSERCGLAGDVNIRRWKLVDFLSNRTFELEQKKIPLGRHPLPASAVKVLMEAVEHGCKTWSDAKKLMTDDLKKLSLALPNSEWNKAQFEQLGDIVAPSAILRRGRASMSASAASLMVAGATVDGTDFEPARMEQWKKDSGLYLVRAAIDASGGIYPQVQTLLGTLRKRKGQQPAPKQEQPRLNVEQLRQRAEQLNQGDGCSAAFATEGFLQRLFSKTLKDKLKGKTVPDFCVVECVKDPAINSDKAKEREKKQKENRARREKLAASFGKTGNVSNADFLRMRLFTEQGGSASTPAKCPFTHDELRPEDLFTGKLQLAHLYPDSRGGLYMADNLVLTTAERNKEMQNMTPREAAAAALPGWLSWKEMLKKVSSFEWGKAKRDIFAAEQFPDFNNMTRTAQLARELRRLVAVWMGIAADAEALRVRLGNPSGVYTAAARRSFAGPEYKKDRSDNTHHRFDAALMTCLPPTGMNDVLYGGIFLTEKDERANRTLLCLQGLNVPDFQPLMSDASECPVIKINSRSKYKSLGDSTFWGVDDEGLTHQRTPLSPDKVKNAHELHDVLVKMGIRPQYIPSEKVLEKWLVDAQAATKADKNAVPKPLRLTNGTPVRNIWKFGSKGNVDKSPLGWNGIIAPDGTFDQLRSLSSSNDRLELWLGWNARKTCWEYYKKLAPTTAALAGIKRMGLPWRGTKGAPEYLLKLLAENKAKDLQSMLCGTLPPHAVKVGSFRKGDVFLLEYEADPKYLEKLQKEGKDVSDLKFPVETWGSVTALNSDKKIETKSLIYKGKKVKKIASATELACLLSLPEQAKELADSMKLNPPV